MNSIMLIHSKWIPYLYIKNTKTCDPSRLLFNISDQLNLEKSDKYLALLNLSIYFIWKKIKMSYKNNKLKIPART